jgi:hypothetical protein
MLSWFKELDRILRGETTLPSALRQGSIQVPVGGLITVMALLGMLYGLCMGTFALCNRAEPEFRQVLATVIKVPALFFLTLLVTTPSLYVFNALVGSRLTLPALLRLLVAAMAVILAVLASLGPIVAFFSLTTPNYSFMGLLNVLAFTVAGLLGLVFLLQTLHRLAVATTETIPEVVPATSETPGTGTLTGQPGPPTGALDRLRDHVLGPHVKKVFACWIVVFALVGAQMAWVLRPFIGDPQRPFEWFRQRESSFFEAVWRIVVNLFS